MRIIIILGLISVISIETIIAPKQNDDLSVINLVTCNEVVAHYDRCPVEAKIN